MNTTTLAKLIEVSPDTVRRWTKDYRGYLSPTGSPVKGQTRILTGHDIAVLSYVATLRENGENHEQITDRLDDLRRGDWQDLPPVPREWMEADQTVDMTDAITRAREIATVAQLQTELTYTERQLQKAQAQADQLQSELDELRKDKTTADTRVHSLEVELERVRGDVRRLESEITGYNLAYGFGREKPVSIAVVILVALLVGAALVTAAFVLARLLFG